jgi:hypothetical protein
MKEYKNCCCYRCKENRREHTPDCACDDRPVYSREQCMDCPKRHFCDVTKQPQIYVE